MISLIRTSVVLETVHSLSHQGGTYRSECWEHKAFNVHTKDQGASAWGGELLDLVQRSTADGQERAHISTAQRRADLLNPPLRFMY